MVEFRHNLIRPAFCPKCLGDEAAELEDRFHQYTNVTEWKTHLLYCLDFGGPGPWRYYHPRCRQFNELSGLDQYFQHLADIQQIRFSGTEREKGERYSQRKGSLARTRLSPGRPKRRVTIKQENDIFRIRTVSGMKRHIESRSIRYSRQSSATPKPPSEEGEIPKSAARDQCTEHERGRKKEDVPVIVHDQLTITETSSFQGTIYQSPSMVKENPSGRKEMSEPPRDCAVRAPSRCMSEGQKDRQQNRGPGQAHLEIVIPRLMAETIGQKRRLRKSATSSVGENIPQSEAETDDLPDTRKSKRARSTEQILTPFATRCGYQGNHDTGDGTLDGISYRSSTSPRRADNFRRSNALCPAESPLTTSLTKRQANIVIEVPPLPADWWTWEPIGSPLIRDWLNAASVVPSAINSKRQETQPQKRPRGRPLGSRNKKTRRKSAQRQQWTQESKQRGKG